MSCSRPPSVAVREAAQLVRGIIANHDQQARTDHDIASASQDRDQLPKRVCRLLDRRYPRRGAPTRGLRCDEAVQLLVERERWIDQHLSRQQDRGLDYGLEL
jgi:hypothetical protein